MNRDRINTFGEVFTSENEVRDMLDIINNETQRIDSRFLEPACGDGNFLAEVLRRKLKVVERKYKSNQSDFERYSFISVSSIYGVEILYDNVMKCRKRLLKIFEEIYNNNYSKSINRNFIEAIYFLLTRNILWGDALSFKDIENNEPIIFSEWTLVSGSYVKRIDYTLHNLLAYSPIDGENLFSDLGDNAFIPNPLKEFTPSHFLEVKDAS